MAQVGVTNGEGPGSGNLMRPAGRLRCMEVGGSDHRNWNIRVADEKPGSS